MNAPSSHDSLISQRFQLLRLPLILGVIVAHAAGTTTTTSLGVLGLADTPGWVLFLQHLFSGVWARNSVSLLFLMSGYLFFNTFSLTWQSYTAKLQRRLHSLLIPYLFWNLANLLLLAFLQSIPYFQGFFSGERLALANYQIFNYLDAFLGIGGTPIAYPFWFIRDLMVMVVLSPLFYLFARYLPLPGFFVLYLYWFISPDSVVFLTPRSLLFFYLGAIWGLWRPSITWVDRYGPLFLSTYLVVSMVDAYVQPALLPLHHLAMTVGVLAFWYLAGLGQRVPQFVGFLNRWTASAFFVFAVHEPLLTVIRKLSYIAFPPQNGFDVLLLYIGAILLTSAGGMFAWYLAVRLSPRLTRIITGGRA